MNCSRVQDLLPDYSVEMLDSRTQLAVREHLAGCDACREELRALENVVVLVEQYGERQPPPGLFNAVRNRIEAGDFVRERPAWWAFLNTRPARVAGMGLAMAAVAAVAVLPVGGPPQMPDRLAVHPSAGAPVTSTALASSIRQHAMSAVEGPVTERVAWEAMAQLVTLDEKGRTRSPRAE